MVDTQKALTLWTELTGVDPNAKSWHLGQWEVMSMNKALKESLEYDDSQVTTLMLLDYFVSSYLKDRSLSVAYVLTHFEAVTSYLQKCREIHSIIRSQEVLDIVSKYKESLLSAIEHYDFYNDEVLTEIADNGTLALIRRDAFKSINVLTVHQFYQGEETTSRPKYVPYVYEFWNMNSLVKSMCNSADSLITLNIIRDSESDYETYLAFAIRNGQTITVLTDRPNYAHPQQRYMSRRPDRTFSKREEQHHFPYDLLNIEYDHKGDPYFNKENQFGIVKYQHSSHPVQEIKNLAPHEMLWIIMMFSLIEKRFWKERYRTPELSYTGDCLLLSGPATENEKALALQNSTMISVPALTNADVTTESMQDEWDYTPTRYNQWIEERYANVVDESALNFIGAEEEKRVITVPAREFTWGGTGLVTHKLLNFDLTDFGSAKDLELKRRWYARYNKAQMIQAANRKEYEETKDQIVDWVGKHLRQNDKFLLDCITQGELLADAEVFQMWGENEHIVQNILKIGVIEEKREHCEWNAIKLQGSGWDKDIDYCYLTGKTAGIFARFKPSTASALAVLCGVAIDELPEVLRHWNPEPYSGNSILNKVDPMDWVVKNLWRKLKFEAVMFLSKSAYNKLRKDAGLAPNRFWAT